MTDDLTQDQIDAAFFGDELTRREHDLGVLLDHVHAFIGRFVAFPSAVALDAVTLWVAHTHVLEAFDSTPRLALPSAEKQSGKTRTLEVLELLVPEPMHAINCTSAALFRAVAANRPTLLFDEADTYFGPRARSHEELRALINAGHRRGAVAYRVVGDGGNMQVQPFPAFAAVAIAGIGDLPDTITDRAVVIHMKRRKPSEPVEPYRARTAQPVGRALRERLIAWADHATDDLADAAPAMPAGVTDRPADIWEPLVSIADAAGGRWPDRARQAAVTLVTNRDTDTVGTRLLTHIKFIFGDRDSIPTDELLGALNSRAEWPWHDARGGKGLDPRGLADHLRPYGAGPKQLWIDGRKTRGYHRESLADAWERYVPVTPPDVPLGPVDPVERRSDGESAPTGSKDPTGSHRGAGRREAAQRSHPTGATGPTVSTEGSDRNSGMWDDGITHGEALERLLEAFPGAALVSTNGSES